MPALASCNVPLVSCLLALVFIAQFTTLWLVDETEKEGLMHKVKKVKKVIKLTVPTSLAAIGAGYVPGALPL